MSDVWDNRRDCCDDDWFIWRRFETWAWSVLLLVQLSMVVFLLLHGRKDKSLRQAFYVFFVAVTLIDCALALLRTMRDVRSDDWGETIFGIVYDIPFSGHKATISTFVNQITLHVIVPTLGHAQPLFLTAIAFNRFTAFVFPLKHASMWRTRTVVVVMVALAAMSIILGTVCPVASTVRHAVKCSWATRKERSELSCDVDRWNIEWAFEQTFVPTVLLTITSTVCCTVSFVLNISSIAMLIALRRTGRLQRKGPEVQLFAHSLWMLVLQLLLAFQEVVYFTDRPYYIVHELGLQRHGITLDNWSHSTEWLAGVNATREWSDGQLQFTQGCSTLDDDWELPTCNVWYRLLMGVLPLRSSPDFTTRTLEQCLLALSGPVFLLTVSGKVRSAYFEFYFKWTWWKKNHIGVKLFTRTASQAPSLSVTTTL